MDETDAPVTDASIREAAAVLRSLAGQMALPSEQYGEYLGMAARLDSVVEQRQQERASDEGQSVPIPEGATNTESFEQIVHLIHGTEEY